jgi:hypothetical protein
VGLKAKVCDSKAGRSNPLIAKWLRLCVAALTDADEARRQWAVATVLEMAERPVLGLLIDRLVRRLKGRDDLARRQAAQSLADLGAAAVPALKYALLKSHSVEVQVLLVQTLAAISQALPPRGRTEIQTHLAIAQARATSLVVVAAVARADEVLRLPLNSACQPTAPV